MGTGQHFASFVNISLGGRWQQPIGECSPPGNLFVSSGQARDMPLGNDRTPEAATHLLSDKSRQFNSDLLF